MEVNSSPSGLITWVEHARQDVDPVERMQVIEVHEVVVHLQEVSLDERLERARSTARHVQRRRARARERTRGSIEVPLFDAAARGGRLPAQQVHRVGCAGPHPTRHRGARLHDRDRARRVERDHVRQVDVPAQHDIGARRGPARQRQRMAAQPVHAIVVARDSNRLVHDDDAQLCRTRTRKPPSALSGP